MTSPLQPPLEFAWQYFDNAVGAVHFVPGAYVYLHWHGDSMTSPELRSLYIHARNLLQREQLPRILADHRTMPALAEADKQWLLTEWVPETVATTDYSHCAVLRTLNLANRLHTDDVVTVLRKFLTVELFADLASAAAWLVGPARRSAGRAEPHLLA